MAAEISHTTLHHGSAADSSRIIRRVPIGADAVNRASRRAFGRRPGLASMLQAQSTYVQLRTPTQRKRRKINNRRISTMMSAAAAAAATASSATMARHILRSSSLFTSRAALSLSGCGDATLASAATTAAAAAAAAAAAVGGSSLRLQQQLLLPATTSRGFSSNSSLNLPRITERRPNETGRGGRASDAGLKVAVFGATGFLGRYVCSGLGEYTHRMILDCRGVFYFGVGVLEYRFIFVQFTVFREGRFNDVL